MSHVLLHEVPGSSKGCVLQVAWEKSGEPLLLLAEDFLCDPEALVKEAINMTPEQWPFAGIHDDSQYKGTDPIERKLRGNGYMMP